VRRAVPQAPGTNHDPFGLKIFSERTVVRRTVTGDRSSRAGEGALSGRAAAVPMRALRQALSDHVLEKALPGR